MEDKKKYRKKVWLIVGLSILGLILALLIVGFAFAKNVLGKVGRVDPDETISQSEIDDILNETDPVDPDFTGPVMTEEETDDPEGPDALIEQSDKILNIMLVGQDRRPGQGRQRSDSMILCTINLEKNTLTMTSFMRDLWVKIPDKYNERLNVPYAVGGFPLLYKTMESQFGVQVDHGVEVDFAGFEQVIDAMGGVDLTITKAEAGQINRATESNFTAGTYVLNGEQALAYARIRKIGTEFARTSRQRTIMNELFKKVRNLSLSELYALSDKILPLIKTDMTDKEIMDYIFALSKILPQMEVISQRVPIDGAYQLTMINKKSVIYLNKTNMEKNLEFIKQTIGE